MNKIKTTNTDFSANVQVFNRVTIANYVFQADTEVGDVSILVEDETATLIPFVDSEIEGCYTLDDLIIAAYNWIFKNIEVVSESDAELILENVRG